MERLACTFSNLWVWDGKVVAFTRDVVDTVLLPTVLIKEDWLDHQYWKIFNDIDAVTMLLELELRTTNI